MTYEEYKKAYIVDPPPEPRFAIAVRGASLYFADYQAAVDYYTAVLGPPGYVEGDGTRAWILGGTGLTLLKGGTGAPSNAELMLEAESPAEVDRLHAAFLAAGGSGDPPVDTLMYRPVRYASAVDPFGTVITISAPRPA